MFIRLFKALAVIFFSKSIMKDDTNIVSHSDDAIHLNSLNGFEGNEIISNSKITRIKYTRDEQQLKCYQQEIDKAKAEYDHLLSFGDIISMDDFRLFSAVNDQIDRAGNKLIGARKKKDKFELHMQSKQDQEENSKTSNINSLQSMASREAIFNIMKSDALGLDVLFKTNGQNHVKFHLVAAAIYQTIYDLMTSKDDDALRQIFGDLVHENDAMQVMQQLITDVVFAARASTTDTELNDVMNNFRFVDKPERFQSRIEPEIIATSFKPTFKGHLVINHAYKHKDTLEPGDIVNVVLTLDEADADNMVEEIHCQLESLGLEIGRLTGTTNTSERHVSLALRIPYTKDLGDLVLSMNDELLQPIEIFTSNTPLRRFFSTAGELQIVTPMDIRTSCSAVSLLKRNSAYSVLENMQRMIHYVAKIKGNSLPPLHITHGNKPIIPANAERLKQVFDAAPVLKTYLENYNLDLVTAIRQSIPEYTKEYDVRFWSSKASSKISSIEIDSRQLEMCAVR